MATKPKHENQLDYVRVNLCKIPRSQWGDFADVSGITKRTLYNVVNPGSTPGYGTVFALYVALKEKAAAARAPKS